MSIRIKPLRSVVTDVKDAEFREIKEVFNHEKMYNWSYREFVMDAIFKTADALCEWVDKNYKSTKWVSGMCNNRVIFEVEREAGRVRVNVDFEKGKFPPFYSPEERWDFDIDAMADGPLKIQWGGEWTDITQEEFPLHVKRAIFPLPEQTSCQMWPTDPEQLNTSEEIWEKRTAEYAERVVKICEEMGTPGIGSEESSTEILKLYTES